MASAKPPRKGQPPKNGQNACPQCPLFGGPTIIIQYRQGATYACIYQESNKPGAKRVEARVIAYVLAYALRGRRVTSRPPDSFVGARDFGLSSTFLVSLYFAIRA